MSSNLAEDLAIEKPASSCKPFLKWAGGKAGLIPQLNNLLPKTWANYHEPMLGGGAFFFSLKNTSNSYLSDCNPELVNVYTVVRDNLEQLIEHLKSHKHCKDYYYALRAEDRLESFKNWSPIERASRFIFLNKTCFNGLYRVNSKGQFNVPFGDYKNPNFANEQALSACSQKLQDCEIKLAGFKAVKEIAKKGDLVYFDPPYIPLNKTSSFTSYTQDGFTLNDHLELVELIKELKNIGVYAMLSNSYTEFILGACKDLNVHLVQARRAINSKSDSRTAINEVVVTNY